MDNENLLERNCYFSNSTEETRQQENGQHMYWTEIHYPFLTKTNRFNTTSAIWIAMSEGAEFNPSKEWHQSHLSDQCGCCRNDNCWKVEQSQEGEYRFNRGAMPLQALLNAPAIQRPITYSTLHDNDPKQAHAERMVICAVDVNAMAKPECCDSLV